MFYWQWQSSILLNPNNFFLDCEYEVQLCWCQQKRWFSLKAAGACLGCGTVALSPVPAPVENSILEILCPSAEKDIAGSGKRTAGEWCWARTEMLFEREMTILAFFKTEMVKCHPLKGVPSYKTWTCTWKLETLSKMFTGWIQLKKEISALTGNSQCPEVHSAERSQEDSQRHVSI